MSEPIERYWVGIEFDDGEVPQTVCREAAWGKWVRWRDVEALPAKVAELDGLLEGCMKSCKANGGIAKEALDRLVDADRKADKLRRVIEDMTRLARIINCTCIPSAAGDEGCNKHALLAAAEAAQGGDYKTANGVDIVEGMSLWAAGADGDMHQLIAHYHREPTLFVLDGDGQLTKECWDFCESTYDTLEGAEAGGGAS